MKSTISFTGAREKLLNPVLALSMPSLKECRKRDVEIFNDNSDFHKE
jgi:hypothetical protein